MQRLFVQIFEVMKKYPQTDGILLPIFTRLTRRLLELATKATSPTGEASAGRCAACVNNCTTIPH